MTSRYLVVHITHCELTGVLVVKLPLRINLRSNLVSSSANFFRDLCFILHTLHTLHTKNIANNNSRKATATHDKPVLSYLVVRIVLHEFTGVLDVKLCRINLRSNLVSSSPTFSATCVLFYILDILYIQKE